MMAARATLPKPVQKDANAVYCDHAVLSQNGFLYAQGTVLGSFLATRRRGYLAGTPFSLSVLDMKAITPCSGPPVLHSGRPQLCRLGCYTWFSRNEPTPDTEVQNHRRLAPIDRGGS
jgi:hypothetical protein